MQDLIAEIKRLEHLLSDAYSKIEVLKTEAGLNIDCDICHSRLNETGAVEFIPTEDPTMFKKRHICRRCIR